MKYLNTTDKIVLGVLLSLALGSLILFIVLLANYFMITWLEITLFILVLVVTSVPVMCIRHQIIMRKLRQL